MRKSRELFIIFILTAFLFLGLTKLVIVASEDGNFHYLNTVLSELMEERINKSDNILIQTVYAKYNSSQVSISTHDSYEYPVPYYEIDGERFENETLIKLMELADIAMIKQSFFDDIKSNDSMITRTNEFCQENLHYSKTRIFLPDDNYTWAFMSFETEQSTGKIIALKIPEEYLQKDKKTIEQYIDYLNLNSEDWNYTVNSASSELKQIEIKMEDINGIVSVTLVPYH